LIPSSENLFILSDYFGPGEEKVRLTSVSNALAFPNEPLNSAIRVGNMVSDRGPLDISVDGILVESNQSFRSMGEYQSISPGDHEFTVSIPGDPTNIIATSTRTLAPGDFLTLAASGHEDSNSVSLTEDNRRPVPSRARLQLTNVSSSAGAIDFYVVDAGESISSSLPLAAGLEELKQVVVELEAGSFDLVVTNIGSAEPLLGPVPVTLDNNNIYSLILTDADGGGEPIQFVLLDDFN